MDSGENHVFRLNDSFEMGSISKRICFKPVNGKLSSATRHFKGNRDEVRLAAALQALEGLLSRL